MKVLMINGSPNKEGCTFRALTEISKELEKENIEVEIMQVGKKPVRDCIGCGVCQNLDNECVFKDDIVNEIIEKAKDADGFVFGSPVYYSHPSGAILSVLDRVFFAAGSVFANKPGMAIVSARRAGTTASMDVLNKYFSISQMPIVSSVYWNMVHGNTPEDVEKDLEGLQIMRQGGRNMAWLIKSIEAGKAQGLAAPVVEDKERTNFIR